MAPNGYTTVIKLRTGNTHMSLYEPARAVTNLDQTGSKLVFTDRGFIVCGEYCAKAATINASQLSFEGVL